MENSGRSIEPIVKLLKKVRYIRLAELLKNTYYVLDESSTYGSMLYSTITTVEICCSVEQHAELSKITSKETEQLLKAFHALYPLKGHSMEITDIRYIVSPSLVSDEKPLIAENSISQKKLRIRKTFIKNLLELGSIKGDLNLIDFLKLTWHLDEMPSTDRRFQTATEDINQHMIGNNDWEYEYLLNEYLDVSKNDNKFFSFLKNVVDFSVRKSVEQERYVSFINQYLEIEGYKLESDNATYKSYEIISISQGVNKSIKNLIFASTGIKPQIVLDDALNNDIRIVEGAETCLIYDCPIPNTGLLWKDLVEWYAMKQGITTITKKFELRLYNRLKASLSSESPPEHLLFKTYFSCFRNLLGERFPALIPQVYLHYDPKTIKELYGHKRLPRQRMDFLMLLPCIASSKNGL